MHTLQDASRWQPPAIRLHFRPARALREALAEGYRLDDLRSDILAGVVVGVIALPLSMALAIASGVPPQHGLYTAVIAGAVIAALGGSRFQVSGPTAAFVVILAPIAARYGISGLALATLMAGFLQVLMGASGFGRLIEFIPYPVTTGFTAGIAVVIATIQLKDFFGLHVPHMPEHYLERLQALLAASDTVNWPDLLVGLFTLALLVTVPRLTRRVPAPIVALSAATALAWLLTRMLPDFHVETIASRFGGVPQSLPAPTLPWLAATASGRPLHISDLVGAAFAISMLGAIESLLSAVVADGMTGRKHDPDAELFAQGIGNIIAPLFGGFAATGAIARTATNIRSGARSPVAALVHALFVFAAMATLAPLLSLLPMAALAAMLLVVAWNMSELKHALRVLRVAPASDAVVLATCFGLTVVFDMVIAVGVGVVLAALLFMRRMAELARFRWSDVEASGLAQSLPRGVLLYEIGGPLFFGAAQKAVSALRTVRSDVHAVILDLRHVPVMDATGLVNLESALDSLHRAGIFVIIAGVQEQPLRLMARAGWKHRPWLIVWRSFDDAIHLARTLAPSDFATFAQHGAPSSRLAAGARAEDAARSAPTR